MKRWFIFLIFAFLFAHVFPQASGLVGIASAQVIDEIKYLGIQNDWVDAVRNVSGYSPGEMISEKKTQESIKRIQNYLETRGYPLALVKSTLTYQEEDQAIRNILQYQIHLGQPIPITEIQFKIQGEPLPDEQMNRLRQALGFKVQEPFDQEKIRLMKKALETTLATMNFVDSRVVKVEGEEKTEGVALTFVIEIGQQVVFGFIGNQQLAKSDLNEMVQLQKQQGLGRDYTQLIKTRILERYAELGYLDAQMEAYSFEPRRGEPRKVLFKIQEGVQYKIKQLQFDGNEQFTDSELTRLFYKNAADRIQAKIYSEKLVEDAAKSMVSEIKTHGYLTARLVAIRAEKMKTPGLVKLFVFISEGLQTKLQSIQFSGNTLLTENQLQTFLGLQVSQPLNLVQLEDGLDQIRKEYRNRGYLDFAYENEKSLVQYIEKNQFANIRIQIREGNLFKLTEVKVFGNVKTKSKVVLREVQIQPHEVISEAKLLETEDRLRRLGIFSQVSVELQEDEAFPSTKLESYRKLKIMVQEAIPGSVGMGIGFRNDLGIRLFGEVIYSNLYGENHTWAFNLSGNRRITDFRFLEYSAQMSYVWPWFTLGETTFRPSLMAERRQYIQFDADTFTFSASLERELWKAIGLSGALTYSLEQVRQFNAVDDSDNQQIRIGSITPSFRIDLRDHPLIPRKGYFASASFEYASPFLGSQGSPVPVSYGRFQVRNDFHINPLSPLVWYTSLRGGWIKNFSNIYGPNGQIDERIRVPLIKQFALGGINSLRGYILQEINTQDSAVQGYSTFVNYRTQLDFFLSHALSFGPFLDAGNLNVDRFTFGNLSYGAGVGMRYITPLGPVNFDWGFKLFPKSNQDPNVFYFSLGVI